jgi:hypothetical protein
MILLVDWLSLLLFGGVNISLSVFIDSLVSLLSLNGKREREKEREKKTL